MNYILFAIFISGLLVAAIVLIGDAINEILINRTKGHKDINKSKDYKDIDCWEWLFEKGEHDD